MEKRKTNEKENKTEKKENGKRNKIFFPSSAIPVVTTVDIIVTLGGQSVERKARRRQLREA